MRVEVGTPEIVQRQRKLEDRWFGELSRLAFVSVRIPRDGAPVGWLYREAPDHPEDSGWRVLAGDESDEEIDDPQNIALLPLRDLVAAEAGLESLLRAPAPAAFRREPNGEFVPAEPRRHGTDQPAPLVDPSPSDLRWTTDLAGHQTLSVRSSERGGS